MKIKSIALSAVIALFGIIGHADPVQDATFNGDNATQKNQLIGDTDASNNEINSTSTQLGNSANANGATITDIDRTALYELCKPLYEEFANDRIPTELVEMVNAAK